MKFAIDEKRYAESVREYLVAFYAARLGLDELDPASVQVYAQRPTQEQLNSGTAAPLSDEDMTAILKNGEPIFAACNHTRRSLAQAPVPFMCPNRPGELCTGRELETLKKRTQPPVPYRPPVLETRRPDFGDNLMKQAFGYRTRAMRAYEQYLADKADYEQDFRRVLARFDAREKENRAINDKLRQAEALARGMDETELAGGMQEYWQKHFGTVKAG